jgi:hypothetical protein
MAAGATATHFAFDLTVLIDCVPTVIAAKSMVGGDCTDAVGIGANAVALINFHSELLAVIYRYSSILL